MRGPGCGFSPLQKGQEINKKHILSYCIIMLLVSPTISSDNLILLLTIFTLHCKKWCVVLTQVRDYCGNQEKTHVCHNSHALCVKTTHHFFSVQSIAGKKRCLKKEGGGPEKQ